MSHTWLSIDLFRGKESAESVSVAGYPSKPWIYPCDLDLISRDELDRGTAGCADSLCTGWFVISIPFTCGNKAWADCLVILLQKDVSVLGVVRLYMHVEPIGASDWGSEDAYNQVLDYIYTWNLIYYGLLNLLFIKFSSPVVEPAVEFWWCLLHGCFVCEWHDSSPLTFLLGGQYGSQSPYPSVYFCLMYLWHASGEELVVANPTNSDVNYNPQHLPATSSWGRVKIHLHQASASMSVNPVMTLATQPFLATIETNRVALEWVCNLLWSDSIVVCRTHQHSVNATLTMTLGVNGLW